MRSRSGSSRVGTGPVCLPAPTNRLLSRLCEDRTMPRPLKILLIVLVVLAGLFVALDRIGNYVAEPVAANTIKTSQDLPSKPDVDIGGFPFLTQLVARDFDT